MPRDFYPRREADIAIFTRNLQLGLQAVPGAYGIGEPEIEAYAVKRSDFYELYRASTDASRATKVVTQKKRIAAVELEAATRSIVGRVRANPNVSAQMESALGLSPHKTTRTRKPRPTAPPRISVMSTGPRSVMVRLQDAEHDLSRAMPKNVERALLFWHIGDAPPAPDKHGTVPGTGIAAGWSFSKTSTRVKAKITLPLDTPSGSKVWATAAWVNSRGEAGPGATPACARTGENNGLGAA